MNKLEQSLLNDYQRGFSLSPTPFAEMAKDNDMDTATILENVERLKEAGSITRVGPVFRPNTIGVSTLAAMKVPAQQLEAVADLVNQYSEVNHNYEREHDYNLWFVATASNQQHLAETLFDIEDKSGVAVMSLPLVEEYHIDLGFKMPFNGESSASVLEKHPSSSQIIKHSTQPNDAIQKQLISEIQSGFPLVERPYQAIAKKIETDEQDVIRRIEIMLTTGIIRRMGVVVRHRKLGYRANAMVVWNVPDDQVNALGKALSKINCITLCYQRPRHLPDWPYNLFTMIHGKDKETVYQCIEEIISDNDLGHIAHSALFSTRCFKQRGACYSYTRPETHYKIANDGR